MTSLSHFPRISEEPAGISQGLRGRFGERAGVLSLNRTVGRDSICLVWPPATELETAGKRRRKLKVRTGQTVRAAPSTPGRDIRGGFAGISEGR